MTVITISIDGVEVKTSEGKKVLEAALDAGIYIPHVCALRGMKPAGTCRLCQIEVEGQPEGRTILACVQTVAEGMVVRSNTPEMNESRRKALQTLLARHPHICLTCPKSEHCGPGQVCIRFENVTEEQCLLCPENGDCQLQTAVDFIGLEGDFPCSLRSLPLETDNPYVVRNSNLCIVCKRCVRICKDVLGTNAVEIVGTGPEAVVNGTGNKPFTESGCMFCGCCVEVCPTGALRYSGAYKGDTLPLRLTAPVRCQYACPAGVDVPRMARYIAAGKARDAFDVLREMVPMPESCSRICSRPCEKACRRNALNGTVSIRALERFASERSSGTDTKSATPAGKSGKKVAIIGSGPSGMTAAYYLCRKGHEVTVLEAGERAGGSLRKAPGLPSEVIDNDIARIRGAGVDVRTSATVSTDTLKSDWDAVFLTDGSGNFTRELGLKTDEAGAVKVNKDDLSTSNPGIYAEAELTAKEQQFIQAIAEGRKAARSIDIFLGGSGSIGEALAPEEQGIARVGPRPDFARQVRSEEPATGYSDEAAEAESKRCMNCDLRVQAACLVELPPVPVRNRPVASESRS